MTKILRHGNPREHRVKTRTTSRAKSATVWITLLCAIVTQAHAGTITVTSTNDSGPGSLRQALAGANDGDTITFAVTGIIELTSGELLVDRSITISGPGADSLAVDGNNTSRVFYIGPTVAVLISDLTITNGNANDDFGGGIYNDHSTLTINTCTVGGNAAGFASGGGVYSDGSFSGATVTVNNSIFTDNSAFDGGAIYSIGDEATTPGATVTVNNSTFSGNSTSFNGAGIYNFGEGGNATVTVNNSTFSSNSAGNLGGAFGGGIYSNGIAGHATVAVSNSTFNGNSTSADGGGIYNDGFAGDATLIVSNSTFTDNSSIVGGGGIWNNGESGNATLTLNNCTFSGNFADSGGDSICNDGQNGNAPVTLANTIFTSASGNFCNPSGTITSLGYNLSNDDGGGFLTGPGDQINTDPLLGPLQDNGGPTFTHRLLPGSPAIDAGDPIFTPPPFFDQRGLGFDRVVNGWIDIGSFEVQSGKPTPTPTPRPIPTPRPRPTPQTRPTPR